MTRFLFTLLILISVPAMAKDDGGFGSARFTAQAPSALGGSQADKNNVLAQQQKMNPADIEPAAGVEENEGTPFIEKSNHQIEPYTINKDLEVR